MDNKDFINEFRQTLQNAVDKANASRKGEEQHVSTLGQDIAKMLTPYLKTIADSSKRNKQDMREAMQELAANASAREMPGVDTGAIIEAIYTAFGNLNMPQPRVNVTTPAVNVPPIRWPDGEMPIKGWVNLMGVNLENPLPVQLRDAKGRPVNLDVGAVTMMGGGASGGKGDYFTIKGFSQSAFAELQNPDGRVKVELPSGSSGLTDTELRATAVPVSQVSGANWSVTASLDTTVALYNGDNRLRVSVETGGSGLSDAELRASSVPVEQVSGSIWSTNVLTMPAVVVTSVTNTIAANVVDSGGVPYTTTNPVPVGDAGGSLTIDGTVTVSGVTASVAAAIVDSGGVQYSTSNPVPIGDAGGSITIDGTVSVTGSITSTVVTGPVVADAVDDGTAPVQGGGIARTANPTAVAGNDVVKSTHDDLGRQVMRPVQVRDLISTAYVSLTTGTETTLLAAVAGVYLDLVYVMGTNNSDAAVTVDIRAVTAGNIQTSVRIPANGTAGVALPVPIPQDETGNNWTADLPDITGSTVTLSALFSREV